nr:DUF397 domain-containing protein [Streptomyces sp. BK205]
MTGGQDTGFWRTSSHSGGNSGQCCEVAQSAGRVLVRDSKQPNGSILVFNAEAWRTALASLFARGSLGHESY